LKVRNIPKVFNAKLPLHPENPERGFREYRVELENGASVVTFWITRNDSNEMEVGKVIRLMELFNIQINAKYGDSIDASFLSESYEEVRNTKTQLIHWILMHEAIPCQVVMPDNSHNEGFAESACKKLKPNDVIQFERFGFVRIDETTPKLTAYYAHK